MLGNETATRMGGRLCSKRSLANLARPGLSLDV
jgi:hypothetical protein